MLSTVATRIAESNITSMTNHALPMKWRREEIGDGFSVQSGAQSLLYPSFTLCSYLMPDASLTPPISSLVLVELEGPPEASYECSLRLKDSLGMIPDSCSHAAYLSLATFAGRTPAVRQSFLDPRALAILSVFKQPPIAHTGTSHNDQSPLNCLRGGRVVCHSGPSISLGVSCLIWQRVTPLEHPDYRPLKFIRCEPRPRQFFDT